MTAYNRKVTAAKAPSHSMKSNFLVLGCAVLLAGCVHRSATVLRESDLLLEGIEPRNRFEVLTDSMLPAIAPGDFVYLDRTPYNRLRAGDVVLFRPNGAPESFRGILCHRLVAPGRWPGSWVTKGDHATEADSPLLPESYIGRAVFVAHPGSGVLMARRL